MFLGDQVCIYQQAVMSIQVGQPLSLTCTSSNGRPKTTKYILKSACVNKDTRQHGIENHKNLKFQAQNFECHKNLKYIGSRSRYIFIIQCLKPLRDLHDAQICKFRKLLNFIQNRRENSNMYVCDTFGYVASMCYCVILGVHKIWLDALSSYYQKTNA